MVDLKEVGREYPDCTQLAGDKTGRWAVVNTAVTLLGPQSAHNLLTS